jgi:hypothetical protein
LAGDDLDDQSPSVSSLRFAGGRAAGVASGFLEQLIKSDVPPHQWEEVIFWLEHLVNGHLSGQQTPPPDGST